ncbi:Uma2 family endonuclease [Candidatus Nitrospira inopinata]|uniref:Putative restriction endonuclease domain-containing protein n=1 Tax=Candidatus Nitrospira inopinata TaxID=1715989 RepID=A0A0S4KUT8_9BACT|nr:Uma2 family endonuclease [Candidatus Nitrospira inopinata]CUQ68179.1 conserved protein of unknown function [Candidatus Nitrospira inopinata]
MLLPDDGKRHEIIEGDLFVTLSPITRHQLIIGRFLHRLTTYRETHPVGMVFTAPYDVVLSETDIVQPDLLLALQTGRAVMTEKNLQGPPDLILEVLSPSTAARDRELKRKRYEHFGVRKYWPIDPDANSLDMLALQDGHYAHVGRTIRPAECASILRPDLVSDLGSLLQ